MSFPQSDDDAEIAKITTQVVVLAPPMTPQQTSHALLAEWSTVPRPMQEVVLASLAHEVERRERAEKMALSNGLFEAYTRFASERLVFLALLRDLQACLGRA